MRRQNNIDLIRLVLSCTVLFQHLDDLTTTAAFEGWRNWFSGTMAVEVFFIISGFLILQSYERSNGIGDFADKRFRRLYPGYVGSLLFFVLLLGFFSARPLNEYLLSRETFRYLGFNLIFLNFKASGLPGFFPDNPDHGVNGALWTIKVEVLFYLTVPLIAWLLRRFNQWAVFAALVGGSAAYYWVFSQLRPNPILVKQLPGQLTYFVVGMILYKNLDFFIAKWRLLVPVAVLGLLLARWEPLPLLRPISLGVLLCAAAWCLPHLGNAGRYGDFSYGIYVVHFPMIQLFQQQGWFIRSPYLGLISCLLAILGLAWLSWHFIEKRFLKSSSHYVRQAVPAAA